MSESAPRRCGYASALGPSGVGVSYQILPACLHLFLINGNVPYGVGALVLVSSLCPRYT